MSNPTLQRDDAEKLARERGCQDSVMILGLRSATSKYGEYDDTLALLTPDEYIEWKGNTLPSKWAPGIGKLWPGDYLWTRALHGIHHFDDIVKALGAAKCAEIKAFLEANILTPADYPHALVDKDGNPVICPYPALRQAGPMVIIRDGEAAPHPDGWPSDPTYTDGHHGGWSGTSSLLCQTWHPEHWIEARKAIWVAMDKYNQKNVTYGLHQMVA